MISPSDEMKRALDEIELEEIEHFYMEQRTLIIKNKTEKYLYHYPSELGLLRKARKKKEH